MRLNIFMRRFEGQSEDAAERSIAALHDVPVLVFFFALAFLFAGDDDPVAFDFELDVVLVDAGQFGGDLDGLVGFRDIHRRRSRANLRQ